MRPVLSHPLYILLLMPSLIAASAQAQVGEGKTDRSDPIERMHGEKVLPANESPLINPICRFDDHPWFEISNLRPGRLLSDALELDFAVAGEWTGSIHVVVLTGGKRHRFPVTNQVFQQRTGVFKCSYSVINDTSPFEADIEAYVELTDAEPMTYNPNSQTPPKPVDPVFFKISKSATRGNVPTPTLSREIRPDELRIYTARRKKYGPPPPPPAEFTVVDQNFALVPGTPVVAPYQGDWLPGEVLAISTDGRFVVHWPKLGHNLNRMLDPKFVAVSRETLQALKTSPKSFKASVELPLGSVRPPENGYVVLPDDVTLVPGVPVRVGADSWDYTVELVGKNDVTLRWGLSHLQTYQRRQICISRNVIEQLKQPDAEKRFADRLKELANANPRRVGSIRSYPIDVSIPNEHSRVDSKTPLKPGTRCMAYWGRRWSGVTVISVPEMGGVEIKWDGWNSVELVSRDSLIIASSETKETNKALNTATATKSADPPSATKEKQYRLILEKIGEKKGVVIKGVMKLTELDLKTSTEVIADLPIELTKTLSKSAADDWKSKFEQAGATVKVELVE